MGVQFNIPDIVIKPSLQTIQDGVQRVAAHLVDISKTIMWWAADVNESFHHSVTQDQQVSVLMEQLSTAVTSKVSYFVVMLTKMASVNRIKIAGVPGEKR